MKKINNKDALIIILIVIVFLVNSSLIFNNSVWQDEAYTMTMIKRNFTDIVKTTADDVHPPLYYFIAKIFTIIFGYSVPVVKMASILPVIISMLFIWLKCKKIFPKNYATITIVFDLLIGFMPAAFVHNTELRMYTWTMLFTTCSGIFAYELYLKPQDTKNLILFVLSGLCAAYTHYYAALTECFVYMFLIISLIKTYKAWKECLVIIIATIAMYLLWLPVFVNQFIIVRDYWWLDTFNYETILNIIKYLFNGTFTNLFLIIISIVIIGMIEYMLKNKKGKEMKFALFCILAFVLMVVTGCVFSLLLRPVFLSRYLYTAVRIIIFGHSYSYFKNRIWKFNKKCINWSNNTKLSIFI